MTKYRPGLIFTIPLLVSLVSNAYGQVQVNFPISASKELNGEWTKSLFDTMRTIYRGEELKTIGMPIGGIAAGQLYIRGDGTLAEWWIANNAYNTAANSPLKTPLGPLPVNYTTFTPVSFIDQGFKIKVSSGGKTIERTLDKKGFHDIAFIGEYPIAEIRYQDAERPLPVSITMKAFSPFIPLDAKESATPGTYLIFKVKNNTNAAASIDLAGWLQNPVCLELKDRIGGLSRNQAIREKGRASLYMDMAPEQPGQEQFHETVFTDFEEGNVSGWTITGKAFDQQPSHGRLGNQQPISGVSGKQFVNSYTDGDKPTGQMVSPEFEIKEDYINLLVGGGRHPDETAVQLVVDGKVLRSATGNNAEALEQVSWKVKDLKGKKAHFKIIDHHTGDWGHITADRITFSNIPLKRITAVNMHPYFGNLALSVLDPRAVVITNVDDAAGKLSTKTLGDPLTGQLSTSFQLGPKQEKEVVFMLTWYFPNRPLHYGGGWSWGRATAAEGPAIGNMYTNWYGSSLEVADWLQNNRERLTELTFRFHKTYYQDGNLPYWLRHRLMMPVSTLATETSQWWATDKFWAWEGVGSCSGTCTHVWNYEQALAHLFPELERNIRERTDFSTSFRKDGGVLARNGEDGVMIDGHIGTILKSYREHLNSSDQLFLTRNWENIKKVIDYAMAQDRADGARDGIIQNEQPNTYDVPFYGANTFIGSLYLAALKAGEKMALEMNDRPFADSCRATFESGSRLSVEKLWNGRYFVQDVNLNEHPKWQYKDGCLSDQVFGQTWAHLLNLGYIYPQDNVRTTLRSVWEFNWTKDVAAYNKIYPAGRLFALPGDPGLFNCTWPFSKHLGDNAVPYKDEVWTGIEYQVATNMIYEGMINEALSIVKAIHERYRPDKHNPWNEIECGDHYARALASWGVLLALEDYVYDGPAGSLSFSPKIQQNDFTGFFTAAKGWGNLVQQRAGKRQTNEIRLAYGELNLDRFSFEVAPDAKPVHVTVKLNNAVIPVKWEMADGKLSITDMHRRLKEGDKLQVSISN